MPEQTAQTAQPRTVPGHRAQSLGHQYLSFPTREVDAVAMGCGREDESFSLAAKLCQMTWMPPSSPPHPQVEKHKLPPHQTPPPTNSGEVSLALKPQAWAVFEPHGERTWFCFSSDRSDALLFSGVWPFVLSGLEPSSTS